MPRTVPEESDTLCESCGYTLNGLPGDSNCPECGQPIVHSTQADGRGLTGFERRPGASSFLATTVAVLARPKRFYRGIVTRTDHPAAGWFAQRHRLIAAALFSAAAVGYAKWLAETAGRGFLLRRLVWDQLASVVLAGALFAVVFGLMTGLTRLAAWLSALEGRYWGMRLPQPAVLRCLQYHTACYLPVGIVAVLAVWGYRLMLRTGLVSWATALYYPWILSALVIVSAGYLFRQYMIAMRSIRFANR
mgnify:CR=1 FL=1